MIKKLPKLLEDINANGGVTERTAIEYFLSEQPGEQTEITARLNIIKSYIKAYIAFALFTAIQRRT